jgi:AraC-like DNA-binding protein/quercetin dioxygenase-like cupin family protein
MSPTPFEKNDTASITQGLELPLVHRVALVRSHSASRIGWHSHSQYEALFLGEGATVYEVSDGRTIRLFGGQCLVIPPGTVHRGLDDVRQPALLCGVMFETSKSSSLTRYTPFSDSDLKRIQEELDWLALKPVNMSRELRTEIQLLPAQIEAFDERNRHLVLSLRLRLCRILLELSRHRTNQVIVSGPDYVEKAIGIMRDTLHEPISILDLATKAGCSRAHLFSVFKEKTGMTPNDYWQRMRVQEAFRRVTESNDSFTRIAIDCGFSTSQYFCSVFRKYWGTSPSECRKKSQSVSRSSAND